MNKERVSKGMCSGEERRRKKKKRPADLVRKRRREGWGKAGLGALDVLGEVLVVVADDVAGGTVRRGEERRGRTGKKSQ
jgi:hypothetical protein